MLFRRVVFTVGVAAAVLTCVVPAAGPVTVSIDASTKYQTFRGWEAAILPSVLDYVRDLPEFGTVAQLAAGDLGVTRLRVDVPSGTEGPPGYGARYINRQITERELFSEHAYNIVNDNNDPKVANLAAFDFSILDWQMSNLVIPYKQALEATGQTLYLYLTYVDFGKSPFEHMEHPAEYGEFMLVLFEHIKSTYGFVPDGIDVMNEPDNVAGWTGPVMGQMIAAAGSRLAAAGYHPDFIAPSTVNRANAVPYLEGMLTVRGASRYLKTVSFHCYSDYGQETLEKIGAAAARRGLESAQNECWRPENTARSLLDDLKRGRTSAWQQATLRGRNGYYSVDRTVPGVQLNAKTKLMRQYYKYIRPGAVRVEARTDDAGMDPVAFIGPDGRYVVVVLAQASGVVNVDRLPPGAYEITYTTAAQFDVHAPDVQIAAGEAVSATIPAAGVLTIRGKS